MSAADASNVAVPARKSRAWLRPCALSFLGLAEFAILDSLYDVRIVGGGQDLAWLAANYVAKLGAYGAFYAVVAFTLMMWPRRAAWAGAWSAAQGVQHPWRRWTAVNIALFALLALVTPLLHSASAPWAAFAAWLIAVAFMLAALLPAAASLAFWRAFIGAEARTLCVAALIGFAVVVAATASQNSWSALAGATLHGAYALLNLVGAHAYVDADAFILGAGDFRVRVDSYCSGYEGVGLVLAALGAYLLFFRAQLRFPNAYLLLPLGAAAILALNVVRISALIWLGANVSSEFALKGFHSQAGWIAFIAVTGALMALAHGAPFFRKIASEPKSHDPAFVLALALLTPFALLMSARIVGALAGENAHWIPVIAALLPAAALYFFRDALRRELGAVNWEPAAIGLIVAALWIATEPVSDRIGAGWWLMAQSPAAAAGWVALRLIGFALIVPIAEELLFRGYLHRALVKRRFDEAAPAAFGWTAFLITSLLFGAMHGRWLAGALAGAAFAFALYRSKTLTGAIVAHAVANGAIAIWAIAMQDWRLL